MSYARPVQRSTRQYDLVPGVGQTVFGFPDPLFDTADLLVLVQASVGGAFWPALPGAFTVALTTQLNNATVTFAAAPRTTTGQTVTVRLVGARVQSRLSDVTRGGGVQSKPLEDELDRQAIILQELRRDISYAVNAANSAFVNPLSIRAAVRRSAWLSTLEALRPGAIADVASNIPGNPANPLTLSWADGAVQAGSALAAFVQARYGFTDSTMAALFAAASTLPSLTDPAVKRSGYLSALEAMMPGAIADLATNIPGNPASPVALAWADGSVTPGSALAAFVQLRYGLSAIQMTAIFIAAASY